ncbi:MAG: hypothetical protein ACM3O7_00650 [Acidobacteriota bacterium]
MVRVSAELTVDEVLAQSPAAAGVFIAHRMACVGCAMARFDTVGEATAVYGIALGRFVDELRASAAAAPRKERE